MPHPDKKRAASFEVDHSVGTSLKAFSASDAEFSNTEITPSANAGHGAGHMFSSGAANSSQTASPLAVPPSAFPLAGSTLHILRYILLCCLWFCVHARSCNCHHESITRQQSTPRSYRQLAPVYLLAGCSMLQSACSNVLDGIHADRLHNA